MNKKQIIVALTAVLVLGAVYYISKRKKTPLPKIPAIVPPAKTAETSTEEQQSNFKTGDVLGGDCYCNGVFSADCCKKLGINPSALNIGNTGNSGNRRRYTQRGLFNI